MDQIPLIIEDAKREMAQLGFLAKAVQEEKSSEDGAIEEKDKLRSCEKILFCFY